MKLHLALAAIAALLIAPLATAQGTAGARGLCAPTNAQKTTIKAIAADPAAWMGKCVSVSGLYAGERLYADVAAAYGVTQSAIGGYVDGHGSVDGFWQADFTGRVSDCAIAEHELQTGLLRSPGISLDGRTLGCVAPQGPFLLFMSQSNLKPAKVTRRLAPAQGDLAPLAAGEPMVPNQRIAQFLDALRAGDARQLALFTGSDYAAEQLLSTSSAIADLRKPADRPMQLFRPRAAMGDLALVACWCRTASCAQKWPIALRDADNHPDRPYACVRVRETPNGDQPKLTFDGSETTDGLPEP